MPPGHTRWRSADGVSSIPIILNFMQNVAAELTPTIAMSRAFGSWILNTKEMSKIATGLKAYLISLGAPMKRDLSAMQLTLSIWMNETESERYA